MSIVAFIMVHAFYAWHAHMNLNTRPEMVLEIPQHFCRWPVGQLFS